MNKPAYKSLRPTTYKQLGLAPAKKVVTHSNPCHDEQGRFCSGGGGGAHDASTLSSKQVKALETYQLGEDHEKLTSQMSIDRITHEKLNQDLRNKNKGYDALSGKQKEITDTIDNSFKSAPGLSNDIVVYRGADNYKNIESSHIGQVWVDRGYLSTTLDKDYAKDFSSKTIAEITVKQGTKALDMTKLNNGDYSHEKEVLLPREIRLKISGVKIVNGVKVVSLEASRGTIRSY